MKYLLTINKPKIYVKTKKFKPTNIQLINTN